MPKKMLGPRWRVQWLLPWRHGFRKRHFPENQQAAATRLAAKLQLRGATDITVEYVIYEEND